MMHPWETGRWSTRNIMPSDISLVAQHIFTGCTRRPSKVECWWPLRHLQCRKCTKSQWNFICFTTVECISACSSSFCIYFSSTPQNLPTNHAFVSLEHWPCRNKVIQIPHNVGHNNGDTNGIQLLPPGGLHIKQFIQLAFPPEQYSMSASTRIICECMPRPTITTTW